MTVKHRLINFAFLRDYYMYIAKELVGCLCLSLLSDTFLDIHTAPMLSQTIDASSSSCPVFLSYQWDLQDTVKRLKNRIEEGRVQCWMDIGKMGGGDALFAKIDAGIRACKVSEVIS